jgi:hypothetical protein
MAAECKCVQHAWLGLHGRADGLHSQTWLERARAPSIVLHCAAFACTTTPYLMIGYFLTFSPAPTIPTFSLSTKLCFRLSSSSGMSGMGRCPVAFE